MPTYIFLLWIKVKFEAGYGKEHFLGPYHCYNNKNFTENCH